MLSNVIYMIYFLFVSITGTFTHIIWQTGDRVFNLCNLLCTNCGCSVVWLEMQFVHISSWRFVLNNSEG